LGNETPHRYHSIQEIVPVLTNTHGSTTTLFQHVPDGRKENVYFVVDNEANMRRRERGDTGRYSDDCGKWKLKQNTTTTYFLQHPNGKLRTVDWKESQFCIKRTSKDGNIYVPLDPQPDPSTILTLVRFYVKHRTYPHYERRVSWITKPGAAFPLWALYEYKGTLPDKEPEPVKREVKTRKGKVTAGLKARITARVCIVCLLFCTNGCVCVRWLHSSSSSSAFSLYPGGNAYVTAFNFPPFRWPHSVFEEGACLHDLKQIKWTL
jgi:hypothetical protein